MELDIPERNPKKLASQLAKDPEKHMARLEPTHDIAAFMLVSESPYFQYLPEEFKGAETALAAVRHSGTALKHIPDELKTPELCLEAALDGSYGWRHDLCPLAFIPENVLTPEMCLAASGRDLDALNFFPAHLREGSFPVRVLTAAIQAEQPISLKDCKDAISSAPFWLAMALKGWPSSGIPEHVPFAPYKLIKAKE